MIIQSYSKGSIKVRLHITHIMQIQIRWQEQKYSVNQCHCHDIISLSLKIPYYKDVTAYCSGLRETAYFGCTINFSYDTTRIWSILISGQIMTVHQATLLTCYATLVDINAEPCSEHFSSAYQFTINSARMNTLAVTLIHHEFTIHCPSIINETKILLGLLHMTYLRNRRTLGLYG